MLAHFGAAFAAASLQDVLLVFLKNHQNQLFLPVSRLCDKSALSNGCSAEHQ